MSDHDVGNAAAAGMAEDRNLSEDTRGCQSGGERRSGEARSVPTGDPAREPAVGLPMVVPPVFWEKIGEDAPGAAWARSGRHWTVVVAALALAAIAAGTAAFVAVDRHRQTDLLAERARESARLEQTVSALNARLQAVEAAKGRDELAEVRRSVGDIRAATATSRELGAAIAQLSQRVERLDREQGAKLDKLGQRVDQQGSARTADLAARLDKLEKKPAQAATTTPGSTAPPAPPKFGAKVSMDPTGSIARTRQVLRGYVVLGAQDDTALIGGRYGERAVRPGDYLPGAGRVERVERQGANWIVVTEQGLIASAYAPY